MKKKNKFFNLNRIAFIAFILGTLIISSCTKDVNDASIPDNTVTTDDASRTIDDYVETDADRQFIWARVYRLHRKDSSGVRGFAVFRHTMQGTLIRVHLMNTTSGMPMPAHIHKNAVMEGGSIAITLNPVNGTTGKSTTLVASDDAGNPLSFANLIMYNGHINVHAGVGSPHIVSCGDIGGNKLTPIKKVYPLFKADSINNIKGFVVFRKRVNNNSLAMIKLQNTIAGSVHPAHIHWNDVATGGPIAFTFNHVKGSNGISMTNVKKLNNGSPFKFQQILQFNGHINVHFSPSNPALVSHGDIGSNF